MERRFVGVSIIVTMLVIVSAERSVVRAAEPGQVGRSPVAVAPLSVNAGIKNVLAVSSFDAKQTVVKSLEDEVTDLGGQIRFLNEAIEKLPESARFERGQLGSEIAKRQEDVEIAAVAREVIQGTRSEVPAFQLRRVEERLVSALRPVWALCGVTPIVNEDKEGWLPYLTPFLAKYGDRVRSVGRIEREIKLADGSTRQDPVTATGFLIGPRQVLTNRHVLQDFFIFWQGRWQLYPNVNVSVNFGADFAQCQPPTTDEYFSVANVGSVGAADDDDWAILELDADVPRTVLKLDDAQPAGTDDRIVVVGFPARPRVGDRNFSESTIDKMFYVPGGPIDPPFRIRRIAPGVLSGGLRPQSTLFYDANTAGGSSGSAVLRISDGALLGIHFGGDSMAGYLNGAVDAVYLRGRVSQTASQ